MCRAWPIRVGSASRLGCRRAPFSLWRLGWVRPSRRFRVLWTFRPAARGRVPRNRLSCRRRIRAGPCRRWARRRNPARRKGPASNRQTAWVWWSWVFSSPREPAGRRMPTRSGLQQESTGVAYLTYGERRGPFVANEKCTASGTGEPVGLAVRGVRQAGRPALLAERWGNRQVGVEGDGAGGRGAGACASPAYECLACNRGRGQGDYGTGTELCRAGATAIDSDDIAGHGAGVALADLQRELAGGAAAATAPPRGRVGREGCG